jgi:hypothetical protein
VGAPGTCRNRSGRKREILRGKHGPDDQLTKTDEHTNPRPGGCFKHHTEEKAGPGDGNESERRKSTRKKNKQRPGALDWNCARALEQNKWTRKVQASSSASTGQNQMPHSGPQLKDSTLHTCVAIRAKTSKSRLILGSTTKTSHKITQSHETWLRSNPSK